MTEEQAKQLASVFGGYEWNSGGDFWVMIINRGNGITVFSEECVCEYDSLDAFEDGAQPRASINLV